MTNLLHPYSYAITDTTHFRDDDRMEVESSSGSSGSVTHTLSTSGSPTPGPHGYSHLQSDDQPFQDITTLLTCGNCSHDVVLSGQLITSGLLLVPDTPVPHILFTNATPSPHEEPKIHTYLHTTTTAIAKLDWEIARLTAILQMLAFEREKLVNLVEEHKALLTPFRKIPPDVMTEIFLRCERGSRCDVVPDIPDSFDRNTGPLLLTQVCQRWRDHALRMPELWSNIRVRIGRGELQESRRLPLIHTWLERSSEHPLNVCMEERLLRSPTFNSDSRNVAVGMLINISRRWKNLSLVLRSPTVHWPLFSKIKGLPLPLLQHCTIITPPRDQPNNTPQPDAVLTNLLSGATALTSLTLDYDATFLQLNLPRKKITHLDLYVTNADRSIPTHMAFEILSHCPSLISFRVQCHVPAPFSPSSHLYHPALTSLDIRIESDSGMGAESLLTHLTPSNLVHLTISTRELEWNQDTILSFIARCAPLQSLTLQCKRIEKQHLLELLAHTKSLTSLTLDIGLINNDGILSDLSPPPENGTFSPQLPTSTTILIPKLTYLELQGRLFVSDQEFLSFITSRRYPLSQYDVSTLKEITVDCDGLVYGFMSPDLIEQLDQLRWWGLEVRVIENGKLKYPLK
jgi:hypothetical protein